MLEAPAPERASALYLRAVQLYTDDALGSQAQEIVQRAVAVHLRASQWAAACAVLLKWALICHSCENALTLCRAYLSAFSSRARTAVAADGWA